MMSRRTMLKIGGGAVALGGSVALASPGVSAQELAFRYLGWLHMERRLAAIELGCYDAELQKIFIAEDRVASAFHFPHGGDWRDVPKPSTRAATVLGTVGVFLGPDDDLEAWLADCRLAA